MDQRIVKLQIANEFIVGSGVSIGAVGSHDDVLLEMDFRSSAQWAGTTRRAIFSNALGENRTPIILTTNLLAEGQADVYLVPVPAEAKDVAGDCFLTVEGFISEGEREILRIVTEEATFRVLPSKLYHNENPSLTPTELEQLQAEIDDVKEDIVKAAQASVALDKTLEAQAKAEEAAEAAHDAQEAVENLSVTGENVPADSDTPVVEKQVNEDGSVTLHFNTRQGVSGVYVGEGDMPEGYDVQVNPEGEALSIEDIVKEILQDDLVEVKPVGDIAAEQNLPFSIQLQQDLYVANTVSLAPVPEDGETVIVEIDGEKYIFTAKTYDFSDGLNVWRYLGNLHLMLKGVPELDTGEDVLVLFSEPYLVICTTKEGDRHLCHVYKAVYKINEEYLEHTDLAARVSELEKGEEMEALIKSVNERVSSLEQEVAVLLAWKAEKEYVNITASASHNRTGAVEKGTVFNDVTVSWTVSRVPTALTISGSGITGTENLALTTSGSKKITGLNINADNASTFSWTVKATGEKETDVATAKASGFNFRTRVYYGAAAAPATINSDFVKTLTASGLVSSKVKSIEVNGGGKYIWYCLPVNGSGMGKCSFMSNNFPFDMQEPQTVSVTNDLGYTEAYYVYRSTNQIDVTMKIEVS